MAPYRQPIPPSPVAPARWPSLVQSVGGESKVREFTQANAGEGSPNAWEQGVSFLGNEICITETEAVSGVPCATDVFTDADVSGERNSDNDVVADVLYYWDSAVRSTFCPVEETDDLARDRLLRQTSAKLEAEFWSGARHGDLGLEGQVLDGSGTQVNSGTVMALPYALAALQDAWANCAAGQRGMIHCTPFAAGLLFTIGAIRRESGLLLDVFDNIVVAGAGYAIAVGDSYSTGVAYMTPVVDVHLSEIEVRAATDQTNNTELSIAYRAGLVKHDPCCKLVVEIDYESVCG